MAVPASSTLGVRVSAAHHSNTSGCSVMRESRRHSGENCQARSGGKNEFGVGAYYFVGQLAKIAQHCKTTGWAKLSDTTLHFCL